MEKEGLCHVIKLLKEQKVAIGVIVTDQHKHINKWLQETHPNIKHFYDVWHIAKGKISLINQFCQVHVVHEKVSKVVWLPVNVFVTHLIVLQGLRKKVQALAKQKDCEVIGNYVVLVWLQ